MTKPDSHFATIANALPFLVLALCVAFLYRRDAGWPAWEVYPQVVHFLSPATLDQDAYVRGEEGYGARYFWVRLIAPLVSAFGFWATLSLLNLWVVLGLLLAIALVARTALRVPRGASRCAALLAIVVIVTGPNWTLAAYDLFVPNPAASAVVQPLLILSLLASASGRAGLGVALVGLASIVHPSLGLLVGAVGLMLAAVDKLTAGQSVIASIRALAAPAVILLIFLSVNFVPWLLSVRDPLPSGPFVDIIATYRHPWHYVPSYFLRERDEWRSVVAWVITLPALIVMAWPALSRTGRLLLLVVPAAIVLFIVGYAFIEIVPSRLIAGLIPFRFAQYLMLLLAFLVPAAMWALLKRSVALAPFAAAMILAAVLDESWIPWWSLSLASGVSACAYFLTRRRFAMPSGIPIRLSELRGTLTALVPVGTDLGLIAIAASLVASALGRGWPTPPTLDVLGLALFASTITRSRIGEIRRIVLLTPFVVWFPILILGSPADPETIDTSDVVSASLMARDHTPIDAVILTPPHFDAVRVLSQRAIVTGDSFPFVDRPMRAWFETQRLVYGVCEHVLPCEDTYAGLNANELASLARNLNIGFAILKDDARGYQVLAQSGRYLLVRLTIDAHARKR